MACTRKRNDLLVIDAGSGSAPRDQHGRRLFGNRVFSPEVKHQAARLWYRSLDEGLVKPTPGKLVLSKTSVGSLEIYCCDAPPRPNIRRLEPVNLDRNRIPTPARQLPTLAQTLPTIDIIDTQHFESLPESQRDASHDSEPLELPAGSPTLPPQTLLYDSQLLMDDHIKDALFAVADTQPDECIAESCTPTAQQSSAIVESSNAVQTLSEHGVGSMGSLPIFEAGMLVRAVRLQLQAHSCR